MDVRNSSGRVVSLLNSSDEETARRPRPVVAVVAERSYSSSSGSSSSGAAKAPPPPPTQAPAPPAAHQHPLDYRRFSFHLPPVSTVARPSTSRSTSISSSYSSQTPTTPALVRTDSSDSRAFPSPSPTTPLNTDDPYFRTDAHHSAKRATDDMNPILPHPPQSGDMQQLPQMLDGYPIMPDNLQNPNGPFFNQQAFPQPPIEEQRTYSTTTVPKASQKKNTYPCPVAKQYGCQEYFTTSGHAARHAKKHTGKKDAICPECSKAFTRKDNMEQHRRTHSGVKSNVKTTPSSTEEQRSKKAKIQQQKKTRPPPMPNPIPTNLEMDMLDPALRDTSFPHIDGPQYQMTYPTAPAPVQQPHYPSPPNADFLHPSLHSTTQGSPMSSMSTTSFSQELPSPSLAPALDALALAASRQ